VRARRKEKSWMRAQNRTRVNNSFQSRWWRFWDAIDGTTNWIDNQHVKARAYYKKNQKKMIARAEKWRKANNYSYYQKNKEQEKAKRKKDYLEKKAKKKLEMLKN
jgi:hypothetical protein